MRADPQRSANPAANPQIESSGSPSLVVNTRSTPLGTDATRCGAHPKPSRRVLQQDVHMGIPGASKNSGAPAPSTRARPPSVPTQTLLANPSAAHEYRSWQGQVRNLLKTAIPVMQQPVVGGTDPQRSIRHRQQSGHRTVPQDRCIRAVEYGEVYAVETSQSVGGGEPQYPSAVCAMARTESCGNPFEVVQTSWPNCVIDSFGSSPQAGTDNTAVTSSRPEERSQLSYRPRRAKSLSIMILVSI